MGDKQRAGIQPKGEKLMRVVCGFSWEDDCIGTHIHECISEDEHEEYTNARHFCGCGEKQACIRNEQSYREPEPLLLDDSDDGVPF